MIFIGCEKAREVSFTKGEGSAANEHAKMLVFKSAAGGRDNPDTPENEDMDAAEVAKTNAANITKMLGWSDVTKAHYLGLGEDAQVVFLAKSAADQATEATAAKTVVDAEKAKTDAAAAALNGGGNGVDIAKAIGDALKAALGPITEEVTKLRAEVADFQSVDVHKARYQKEFFGHPQGEAHVVETLKAAAALPEPLRLSIEKGLKSACDMAKFMGQANALQALGGEAPVAPGIEAEKNLRAQAAEVAKAKNISEGDAYERVTEMAANAELVRQADGRA